MLTIPKRTPAFPAPKSFLATTEIFKEVPAQALAVLGAKMTERRYPKGETLFLEGDPAESVWFVKEGYVKASVDAASGRCQTLCMVGAKQMFGTCCCFGGGQYPCHAVAETDVTAVSMRMEDFLAALGAHPSVSRALAAHLSRRLRQAKDMQAFDQETVERRILHVLLDLSAQFGTTLPLTRKEIAEMAGTTVETTIRTFSRLEEGGLVASVRGRITLKDPAGLARRLEGA